MAAPVLFSTVSRKALHCRNGAVTTVKVLSERWGIISEDSWSVYPGSNRHGYFKVVLSIIHREKNS